MTGKCVCRLFFASPFEPFKIRMQVDLFVRVGLECFEPAGGCSLTARLEPNVKPPTAAAVSFSPFLS